MSAYVRGYLFGGFYDDVEVGAFNIVSLFYFDGGNLYDVVVEDVESSGFGVEEYHLFRVDDLDEVLEIGGALVDEEVGGRDGETAQLAHQIAGSGIFGYDAKEVEKPCPGNEAGFVADDVEMGEE